MAQKITAITAHLPRIIKGKQVDIEEVSNLIAGRTSMNPGSILQAISEITNALTFFLNVGRPVKIPGLGIFSPVARLDGTVKLNLRVDKKLASELNKKKNNFKDTMINYKNIGKTAEELLALWNEEHPDDPVV